MKGRKMKQQSKWHNISIKNADFEKLQNIKNQLPIRASIPQTIEWLIYVGLQHLKSGVKTNENCPRVSKQ